MKTQVIDRWVCLGCGEPWEEPPAGSVVKAGEGCCGASDIVEIAPVLRDSNPCGYCGGQGYIVIADYDMVPYGATWVRMDTSETIPCTCVETGACPSCGRETLTDREWGRHEVAYCVTCGFRIDWDEVYR